VNGGPVRILVDECLSRPRTEQLRDEVILPPGSELRHILDYQRQGIRDDQWVPREAQRNWLVITADTGKGSGPKLPLLCEQYKITRIELSARVHEKPTEEKAQAIIAVWDRVLEAYRAERGSFFKLRLDNKKQPILEGPIKKKPRGRRRQR
jgi:hypothetical protein